ncbi:MAG: gliding motility-associated C-terminal domain-containing protein [Flavobacteriales bacterium]
MSECTMCDGGCTVTSPLSGEMTYRWDDSNGNLIALESTSTGSSELTDLCIGSYKLTISSGLQVVDEAFFSITESEVNIGLPGVLYSCTTHENIDLVENLPTGAQEGGIWNSETGEEVIEVASENSSSGLFTYSILNNGCLNVSQIPVIINTPANIGEFPNVQICEDFAVFDFWDYADSDNYPDPNGVFLNEQFEVVDPIFNPQDSVPGEYNYYYRIDSVIGCTAPVDPFFIRVNAFNEAGEDAVSLVCSAEGQELDLNSFLSSDASENGLWYDSENDLIQSVLDESEIEEGLYRYTVTSNVPCLPDVSYVEVVFVDQLEETDEISIVLCSDAGEVNLNDYLEDNLQEFGEWYNSDGAEVDDLFNSALEQDEQFMYEINGLGCSTSQSIINIETEALLSAGSDTSFVTCGSTELIDLNQFLSDDASPLGVWMNEENEIITSFIGSVSGSYRYVIQQGACPDQESVLDILIEQEPAAPVISQITLCQSETPISLNELIELNPEWNYSWADALSNDLTESFIPSEIGVTNLTLTVDAQNSCDVLNAELELEVENNQFENGAIATQICELTTELDISELVSPEIQAANFILLNSNNTELSETTVNLGLGVNVFQIIESGLNACESNVFEISVEQVPYNDAGENQTLEICSDQGALDLTTFAQVEGVWSLNNETLLTPEIELNADNSGIYLLTASNSDVCPASELELELVVQELFEYMPLENIELCSDQEILLTSPVIGSSYSTIWETELGLSSSDELFLDNFNEGETVVSYQITQGICESTNDLIITVYPEFEIEILGETVLCTGDELNLQLAGGMSAEWNLNGNVLAENEAVITEWPVNGAHYTAFYENSAGCVAMDEITVELNQTPTAAIVANQFSGCAPFLLELEAESDTEDENIYQWVVNNTYYTGNDLGINVNEGDELFVQLNVIHSNGCVNSTALINPVIGNTAPIASFYPAENALSYIDPTTEITNDSEGYASLNWYLDGEEINGGSTDWSLELPEEPYSVYQLCLEVTSAEGCSHEYCEEITVNSELLLYIPNAFTPDGDGVNEIFKPHYSGNSTELYEFQIFDRWGHEMFFTENVEEFWNGNVKGGDHYAPHGVYTYIISIKDNFTAEIQTYRGHVTLLR